MDVVEKLLNIKEFKILKINAKYKNKVVIDTETINNELVCNKCKKNTSSIDHRYIINVRDKSVFDKEAFLRVHKKVFICRKCSYRFTEKLDSVYANHPYTKRFEKAIFENCLENTISNVSRSMQLNYDSVKNTYNRIADICIEHLKKYNGEIEILGIDEISIRKGHKNYQAVISNISGGYVMDMLPDRKKETVVKYLKKLPQKGKKRIVFVSMDMWEGYFKATQEVLPDTTIVIDRFHVMKNLNSAITKCRRDIQRELPKEKKDKYKGYRWVLLKNEESMTEEDFDKLDQMMKDCPELNKLYNLKVEFQNIFDKTRKVEVAEKKLSGWVKKIKKLNNPNMDGFSKLLDNWGEWILNYFVSKKVTNAFVEGMNNKIKLIKRMGYGYRSKMNFRRKVLIECGYNNLKKKNKLIFLR